MPVNTPELSKAMSWLHYNTTNPQRRTAALIYALKYMTGPQLVTFTKYAMSISYAFGPTDRELLEKVKTKARAEKAPAATTGIGQFDPEAAGSSAGSGSGFGSDMGFGSGLGFGENYDDYGDFDGPGFGSSGYTPGYNPLQGAGQAASNLIGTFLGSMAKPGTNAPTYPGATGTYPGPMPPYQQPPVYPGQQTLPGQRSGNYVWTGTAWQYSPVSAPTAAPTTPGYTIGQRSGNYVWTGTAWQYSPVSTAPTTGYLPTQPTTEEGVTKLLPWFLGGYLLLQATK